MRYETISFKQSPLFNKHVNATIKFKPNWFERRVLLMKEEQHNYKGYYGNWFRTEPFKMETDKDITTLLDLEYYFWMTGTTAEQFLR